VDTLTALALVSEIGNFSRFASAEELMSFVGLVRCERSSDERRRQGAITRAGNSHARRLLVEAAGHARRRPKVGYELARRQRGQDALVIERAWRCQQRLYSRWQRMAARGKPQQKIVVACARELRRRQLPTVSSHAVSTRECQSDPPSLPRAIRCSGARGSPPNRAVPLDILLHVRGF